MNRLPQATLFATAALVIAIDQASKWWALTSLAPIVTIPIIPNVFSLTFVENTGVAFGMFSGHGLLVSLIIMAVLASATLFSKDVDWKRWEPNLIGGMILGGAFGNLLDRARLGYVVDFIDCHYWPVFNIADSAICIAVALLTFRLLFMNIPAPVKKP